MREGGVECRPDSPRPLPDSVSGILPPSEEQGCTASLPTVAGEGDFAVETEEGGSGPHGN